MITTVKGRTPSLDEVAGGPPSTKLRYEAPFTDDTLEQRVLLDAKIAIIIFITG